jgi:hypothetical protein
VLAAAIAAPPPARVVVLHRSPSHALFSPAVSGPLVAWVVGAAGHPGWCAPGRKRIEELQSGGRTRALTETYGPRSCVYGPVASGSRVLFALRAPFVQIWHADGPAGAPVREFQANGGAILGPGYDLRGHSALVPLGQQTARLVRFYGTGVSTRLSVEPHQGFDLSARWLEAAGGRIVWADDRGTVTDGAALSVPFGASFRGLDAGGGHVVVRDHAGASYRLWAVDPASGARRLLMRSGGVISAPALAGTRVAVLVRSGGGERVVVLDVRGTAPPRTLARRRGAPAWGAGELVSGRPLAFDGRRVVWTARDAVLAVPG